MVFAQGPVEGGEMRTQQMHGVCNMMTSDAVMGGVAANTHSKARQRFQHSSLSTDVVVAHFAGCEQGTIASRIALYECGRQRRRWAFRVSDRTEETDTAARAKADQMAKWIPSVNRRPAPGSAHRVLTYEKSTGATTWEGRPIKPADPIPELR